MRSMPEYINAVKPYLEKAPEQAFENIRTVRSISLAVNQAIAVYGGYEIPSPDVSWNLLEYCADTNSAIGWLATMITIDEEFGCWCLPLAAEYDEKTRARYPQVSRKEYGAHSTLAHRFVLSSLFNPTLTRDLHWDHICRSHACCNPTHGELVTAKTNNARKDLSLRHTTGMETLF